MKRALAVALALTPLVAGWQSPWPLVQKLDPIPPFDNDDYGAVVDIDGTTLVVAAPDDHVSGVIDAGSVYVYVHDGTSWVQEAQFTSTPPALGLGFGTPAVSGDTIVVGVANQQAAQVFERTGTTWAQTAALQGSDTRPGDRFGVSVAIEGDTIIVGADADVHAPGVNGSTSTGEGSAYAFVRSGTTWTQQWKLVALDPEPGAFFGSRVAISGETVAIGAHNDDQGRGKVWGRGAAYVCARSGTTWTEEAKLLASDGEDDDLFGRGVAIDGDTIVVGAAKDVHTPGVPGDWDGAGSAYVFVRGPSGWSEEAKLTAPDAAKGDDFGEAVAVSGDTVVVGATGDDLPPNQNATQVGAAYVYTRDGTDWNHNVKLVADVRQDRALFGTSVAVEGVEIAVGAMWDPPAGRVYAFQGTPPCAGCTSYCTAGTSSNGCTALITGLGTPSASASDGFLLYALGAETQKSGLFYFGTNGRQAAPWGNGTSYQCVVPPVRRTTKGLSGGSGMGPCSGSFLRDLNAQWTAKPHHNPGAGAVTQAQLWYRDPNNTSNTTTSLSGALEFTVAP